MVNLVLVVSLSPIFIIAFYIYYRDKYEKEPFKMLLLSLLAGAFIVLPILAIENLLSWFQPTNGNLLDAAYNAFVVAAFSEEVFKFIALFILIWSNKNFNEKFDGIVYASFISLGFAAVENVMYVSSHGLSVGGMRAFTAVPAHAFFGILMGYYFGLAKFFPEKRVVYMVKSLLIPISMHGVYDFILMSQNELLLLLFIPFIVFMWILGFKKMKSLSDQSIYKV